MDNYSNPSEDKQTTVADTNYQRYVRARDHGHDEFLKMRIKSKDYYVGNQWEKEVRAKLEAEGRPALTINKVLSTVNVLLGEQLARRATFQAKVRKDSSNEQAQVVTKTLMQIAETNDFDNVESEVFRDGLMGGRGYFDVRVNFTDNVNGEVEINHQAPEEVLLSPDDSTYDPAKWREVFTSSWLSLDEIENMYGKRSMTKVKDVVANDRHFTDDSIVFEPESDTFGGQERRYDRDGLDPSEHKDIRAVRVISRQWRKMKMCRFFVDPHTGDMREIPNNWGKAKIKMVMEIYNLYTIDKVKSAIRWTTTADHVVLKDEWSPYRSFTIIPYFCYWVPGRPFGVVENLMSPQDQLNKVTSQELHIVNSTANSGWVYEDGSIMNHTDDEMAQNGSKTGLILTYKKGSLPPEKIQPNQIPQGLDRVSMVTANNIKEISGVSDSLLGQDKAEVSGVAINEKKVQGQVQIQVPLDHLARTRKLLGHKLLELVQDFYTDERVMYITDSAGLGEPREKLTLNSVTPEGAVVNDLKVGSYDIVIGSQPARDAFRDSQFAELLEMRSAGVTIPSYRVVQNSHLAQKDEIAEETRELEGLGQQTPEQQQIAQLQMQAAMQQMQLELQKMSAEIQKISSETVLNKVKAQDLANSDQMEAMQMQVDMAKEQEGNELRRDLATMSAVSTLEKQVLSTKGGIALEKAKADFAPPPQKTNPPKKPKKNKEGK
ncbi:hypothetical protein [Endozoicomonas ascidiicola]|uniref:portal protein n=1 Tax=Endozoicomonas ascidiicola TaxID=1698521 RepID=UPI00082A4DEA|nr:hypothetical protein [Endozoicomonas ascidiicola]